MNTNDNINASKYSTTSIQRREGITSAERYLKSLCDHSFLSLWSYSGVYRDQGRLGISGDGKEICDLLVVFRDHIIIFSDKDCTFPNTGKLELDWNRWVKRAIFKSAEQIWGAERWIKDHPQRIFLDPACTQSFPIDIPDLPHAKFHRILVAHGASKRCKEALGGSGSLMIAPPIIGDMHYIDNSNHGQPFVIGQIDPTKEYIHVFDDISLDIVMSTLDTITDFTDYLSKKELLIKSERLIVAGGEEDLLAIYLQNINSFGECNFILPGSDSYDKLGIKQGIWQEFVNSPLYKAQIEKNKVSYGWDKMIEMFNGHILGGTLDQTTYSSIAQAEKGMRFFASESRAQRRSLALAFTDFLKKAPSSIPLTRVIAPTKEGNLYYVFLLFPRSKEQSDEAYRKARQNYIQAFCLVTKLVYPQALDIVGIATEAEFEENIPHSEDAVYIDARNWNEESKIQAQQLQQKFGFYTHSVTKPMPVMEYPVINSAQQSISPMKGRDRNKLCPCGSGKKYKKCCGL